MLLVILMVFQWYKTSPLDCNDSRPLREPCQSDILYTWSPLIGVSSLLVLTVFLHNWLVVFSLTRNLKDDLNPQPFTRIGSKVVLGLLDTSGTSTISKGSTLVSYVYP